MGDSLYLVIHPFLPRETQEFVPKFLAAAQIGRSPVRYGFSPVDDALVSFDEVILTGATSVDVIARAAETAQEIIEEMNPQLIRGFTSPGSETRIMLPLGTGAIFMRNYQLIPEDERLSVLEHRVVSGDTLGHIALRYGVSVAVLLEANPEVQPTRLQIGYWVRVPSQ
jgi:membrane-bound lytic murein transglycosylase D